MWAGAQQCTLPTRALLLGVWVRNTPCLDLCTEAARTEKSILSLEFVALTMYPAAVTASTLLGVAMEMMCLFQIWLYALVTLTRETRHWTRCTFRIGRAGEVVCLSTGWDNTSCVAVRSHALHNDKLKVGQ